MTVNYVLLCFRRADLITSEYMNATTSSFLTEETLISDALDPFAKMRDYFENFLLVAETYTMTSFACLGLVFNALAIAFLTRDNRMWPMSRCLHFTFLVMEELFLAVTVAFIHFRQFVHQLPDATEISYYEVSLIYHHHHHHHHHVYLHSMTETR